jgi:hypothetical protein
MTVQVPSNRWAGVVVYFLAITGIGLVVTKLSSIVANQAIVLALPHLDNSPPSYRSSNKGVSTQRLPFRRWLSERELGLPR